jgi:plasmid stabilization system protein ParE
VKAGLDPRASAELDEAAEWYEQRRAGLGTDLLDEVRAALQVVSRSPRTGSPIDGLDSALDVRRVPVRRFPYQLVYLVGIEGVVVIAVAHDRRLPSYWASRLDSDEAS